jgi:WD40 repeat protein
MDKSEEAGSHGTAPVAKPKPVPIPQWPVFLCYRQTDGRPTAEWLYQKLHEREIAEHGQVLAKLDVYQDRKAPAISNWREIHLPALERARSLIVIITPGLFSDLGREDWVHYELNWWLKHRRTAPLLVETSGEGGRWIPGKLKSRWPNAQRVEVRLADWLAAGNAEAQGRDELNRIVEGIRLNEQKLVYEDLERVKRLVFRQKIALVAACILFLLAAVFYCVARINQQEALDQANRANKAAKTADSRRIAALSESERDKRLDRALLLAVESLNVKPTLEARNALFRSLTTRPELKSIWHDDRFYLMHVAFNPDGKPVAAEYENSRVVFWDMATRQRLGGAQLAEKLRPVPSVAISPDGRTFAVAYYGDDDGEGGVALWDLATGKPAPVGNGPLVVKKGQVSSVAFSPDNKTIAAGYEGLHGVAGVVLWDAATGKLLMDNEIALGKGGVSSVAFSPDSKTIVAGYYVYKLGGGVMLWDVATGQRRGNKPPAHGEAVSSMAFSPNGKTLVTGYNNGDYGGGIVLWDVATGKPKSADKPESPKEDRLLVVNEGGVTSVVFGQDGKTIAAGYDTSFDRGGGVVLWDMAADKPRGRHSLVVNEGGVHSVALGPDGRTIVAGYNAGGRGRGGGGVVLLDMAAGKGLVDDLLTMGKDRVSSAVFSPDGKTIAAGYDATFSNRSGGAVLWDVATRKRLSADPLALKEGQVSSITFSPDGQTVAASVYVSDRRRRSWGVMLWNVATGKPMRDELLAVTEGTVLSPAFSPDGNTLVVCYQRDKVFRLLRWELATGQTLEDDPLSLETSEDRFMAFSPDGKTLAACCRREGVDRVMLWDVASSKFKPQGENSYLANDRGIISIAFSPDGKTLAARYEASDGYGVVLWDVATGHAQVNSPLAVPEGTVSSLAFSPDSGTIAAGYRSMEGNGVVLWDVATGERLADDPLALKENSVSSVVFSPDGKTIAVGHNNGVAFCDVDLESWKRRAGQIVNRNFTRAEWQKYFHGEDYRATFDYLPVPPE